jgi:hypothetical protein
MFKNSSKTVRPDNPIFEPTICRVPQKGYIVFHKMTCVCMQCGCEKEEKDIYTVRIINWNVNLYFCSYDCYKEWEYMIHADKDNEKRISLLKRMCTSDQH